MKKRLNKLTAWLLTLAMLMTFIPSFTLTASAEAAEDITVTIDTGASVTLQDTDGDGYYEIGTVDELYAFSAAVNAGNDGVCAELMNDIVVNEALIATDGTLNGGTFSAWTPIGGEEVYYTGTFDGGNHTVSGLYSKGIFYAGMFGYINGGSVKNLTVSDSYFEVEEECAGGIAAYSYEGEITGCHNSATVAGNYYIGGIVGSNSNGTVFGCSNSGKIAGGNYAGGIVGSNEGDLANTENCYNTGDVSGIVTVGGIAGYNSSLATTQNCYNIGSVDGTTYAGGIVGYVNTNPVIENCYYLSSVASSAINNATDSEDVAAKSDEVFASGEVAYLLNGSSSENPVWYQTLSGEDKQSYPAFSGEIVYFDESTETYSNTQPNATYTVTISDTIENGTVTADKETAVKGDIVTLTVTPAKNYGINTVSYNDGTNDVEITASEGTYSFTMPASDVTVTAIFTANKHDIIYYVDGEEYHRVEDVAYGTAITPIEALTKTGHTFSGWQASDFDDPIPDTMPDEDVCIFGSFTVNQYPIYYKVDGVDYRVILTDYDTTPVPPSEPTKTGYIFSGWDGLPERMPAEEVIVTAIFTANKHDIIYYVDGVEYHRVEDVAYGTAITPIEALTKTGHTFSGWSEAPETMPDEDVTITAHWEINQYTFTFDARNGTEVYTITLNYGEVLTPPTVTREGYRFQYWAKQNGEDGNIPATMPAYNMNLQAVWFEKDTVEITDTDEQSFTRDGTSKAFAVSGTPADGYTVYYYVGDEWTSDAPSDAGTYNVKITRAEDDTYKAFELTITGGLVINAATPEVSSPTAKALTYVGEAQDLVTAGSTSGGTLKYSLDNATWSDAVPTGTDAGTYEVWYKVFGDTNHNDTDAVKVDVTIAKKSIEAATVALDGTLTYNGSEQTQNVTVTLDGFTVTFDVTDNKATNVKADGSYTLKVTANGNFEGEKTLEWNIAKADHIIEGKNIPTASRIKHGNKLSDSTITPAELKDADGNVSGTFSWVTPDDEMTETGDFVKQVKFTPTDTTNYNEKTFDVTVNVYRPSSVGGFSSNTTITTTKNEDGSTTKVTENKATGTKTEVTTNTDGSTTTVETKKDGTVTTTEKDKDGNTTTTVEKSDGTSTTTEKNKDGSERVTEKLADGTTVTTEKGTDGTKTVTTENADGSTKAEETKKDGTTVTTETTADGETKIKIDLSKDKETEVTIPVTDAEDVTSITVTDKNGKETEITDFEITEDGVKLTVSGDCTAVINKAAKKEFVDVHPVNHWATADIDYAYIKGLMMGTSETHFSPDVPLTRAMLVTVLYRLEGEPSTNRSIPFADVDMGAYYGNAVSWAKQNGIVNGVSETEFAPNDNITREQIAAIMHRYAQYKGYDVESGENTNILSYDDFDSISEYAIASMQYACDSGFLKGKTTSTLNPLDNATRAETAAILHRFIKANK